MIWLPRPDGDFPLVTFLVVATILVACLVIVWWDRRRKRNDPDRGGPGYRPMRMSVPSAPPPDPNRPGTRERWLLGFAAPRVVHEGLDPDRWDLGSEAAPDSSAWARTRARLEIDLASASSPAGRAAAAVELAWWIRVGVATRELTEFTARDETRAVAEAVRPDADDWLAFGDLLGERPGMARPRDLYAPGRPWSDPDWPGPSAGASR